MRGYALGGGRIGLRDRLQNFLQLVQADDIDQRIVAVGSYTDPRKI